MNDRHQNSTGGSEAINRFIEFFDKQGWSYHKVEDKPVIRTGFTGDNGQWQCVAIAGPKDEHLMFLSLLPCQASRSRRKATAELLTRINYGLNQGCFEMDLDDGEIRFRTTLSLASPEAPSELVEHLVFSNLSIVDHFFATIMQVLYAGTSPKAALKKKDPQISSEPRFQLN